MEMNFVETNPIPVKAAMAMMGFWNPLPPAAVPPSPENVAKIAAVLEALRPGHAIEE